MTDIILTGGPANLEKDYVGLNGAVRYDSNNYDILLHDGVTPGGHRIQSMDNADTRYQQQSDELSGIGPFLPEERGLLVRRGPGLYVVRTLIAGNNIVITNPDGYAGDLTIGLGDTITGDLEITGDLLVDGVAQVTGGLNADVSGNLTGNVTGDVTGNLTGNGVGDFSGSWSGDVSVTGHTLLLDDNQIPLSKLIGLTEYIGNEPGNVPVGAILMWFGDITHPPTNYSICNGGNGTPDLRNRFVIGAGSTYDVGAIGGQTTHTHTYTTPGGQGGHDHGLSVDSHTLSLLEMPAHTHDVNLAPVTSVGNSNMGNVVVGDNAVKPGDFIRTTNQAGGNNGHVHGLTVSNNGSHSHSGGTDLATGIIPPFYALAYIMRTA